MESAAGFPKPRMAPKKEDYETSRNTGNPLIFDAFWWFWTGFWCFSSYSSRCFLYSQYSGPARFSGQSSWWNSPRQASESASLSTSGVSHACFMCGYATSAQDVSFGSWHRRQRKALDLNQAELAA